MQKSESIAKLAIALSKLQGEVTDAHKGVQGYGYKYADLAGVLEIARPLCLKYELAVSQLCTSGVDGVGVTTILMHASGEWISSDLLMPLTSAKGGNAAQAAGAIITYARRYSLAAILGITQTDNDAAVDTKPSHAAVVASNPIESHAIDWQQKLKDFIASKHVAADICHQWLLKYGVERLGLLSDAQIKEIVNG